MQQSKAYVISHQDRCLKAVIAARKAEYVAYRYGRGNRPPAYAQRTTRQPSATQHAKD